MAKVLVEVYRDQVGFALYIGETRVTGRKLSPLNWKAAEWRIDPADIVAALADLPLDPAGGKESE